MASLGPARPRVSRETRLLLGTVLLSLVALWVLGRLRFPDRPRSANPVPAVLDQLASRSAFDELATAAAQGVARMGGVVLALPPADAALVDAAASRLAIRLRDDLVVTLMPDPAASSTGRGAGTPLVVVARDAASGLAIVSIAPDQAPVPRDMGASPSRGAALPDDQRASRALGVVATSVRRRADAGSVSRLARRHLGNTSTHPPDAGCVRLHARRRLGGARRRAPRRRRDRAG